MNSEFFKKNRQALLKRMGTGALIVVTGYGEMQQSADMEAPFIQETNFWYLCGIDRPNWWLIIDGSGKTIAVAPELDEVQQAFNGELSVDQAKNLSGVDRVVSQSEALILLRTLAKSHSLVYTIDHAKFVREYMHFHLNPAQGELRSILERTFQRVEECGKEVATLRTIKQAEEIEAISEAARLTCEAFELMRDELSSYKYEYEAEAKLTYEIRRKGAEGHAYSPIVAAAQNACTLHYVQNAEPIIRRRFLLFDVGAKYGHYCADISRTYAIGEVSRRARAVHGAVYAAQTDMIAIMQPGVSLKEFRTMSEDFMKRELTQLKLDPEKLYDYMPHAVSHGLGLDPHDPTAGYEQLMPGMVLTAELGLYLPDEGIGVRIEDDILITDHGPKNLSGQLDRGL